MKTDIEFKYEKSDENVMKQLAGQLQGLKPLNRSTLNPTLDGTILKLNVSYVDPELLRNCTDRDYDGIFEVLGIMFSQAIIWGKITNEDETKPEIKIIINPDVKVELIEKKTKLIMHISDVEVLNEIQGG